MTLKILDISLIHITCKSVLKNSKGLGMDNMFGQITPLTNNAFIKTNIYHEELQIALLIQQLI